MATIIIPARYGSTRFPGKPLAKISGHSLIKRTYKLASAVPEADTVVVATDDQRIIDEVKSFGGEAVMTSESCQNGTERVLEAIRDTPTEIAINLQGDAVLTPPWVLSDLIKNLKADTSADIATPAVQLSTEQLLQLEERKRSTPGSGTLVVFDGNHRALYFSKRIIPYVRNSEDLPGAIYRHIGIYGYQREALERYVELPQSNLEKLEGLEQLRALENGMVIKVVPVDYKGRTHWSVDSPEDAKEAEKLIEKEGELAALD